MSDLPDYAKTWELNVYELNRQPHEVINDDTEIAVSPKSLHNELMCPICLDILKSTMTTKECLHRFCHDCIITALRAGNKECPTCRKKLVSKRSLRPDPNFDALIAKIYPNREEYDIMHEKVLERLHKKQSSGNSGSRRRRSIKQQSSNANVHSEESQQSHEIAEPSSGSHANRKRTISDDSDEVESRTTTSERSHAHTADGNDDVELILKPHPRETAHQSHRFLKTTANATVGHLSKYLSTRLGVEVNGGAVQKSPESVVNEFNLFMASAETKPGTSSASSNNSSSGGFMQLSPNQTLEIIIERFWKQNKPLELFYAFKNTATSASH